MKKIIFAFFIFTILLGCGRKAGPEYQGIKMKKNITVIL